MLGKIALTALLCSAGMCGTVLNAAAQAPQLPSPQAMQAARELTSTTSTELISAFVAQATAANWPQVETALRSKNRLIDASTLAELRQEFERILVSTVATDLADSAYIYAYYFTEQELRELTAFYRTPTGAKLLALMPYVDAAVERNLPARLPQITATARENFGVILRRRGLAAE